MYPVSHNSGSRLRVASAVCVALAALAPTLAGCSTEQKCSELARCGGNLLEGLHDGESEWVATPANACMDDLQLPVNPVSIAQQPAPKAGKKSVPQATADWCSSLVQEPDGTLRFQGYFPIIPLQNAVLTFKEREFQAHFLFFAPQQMTFPAACRAAQGIEQSCPALGRHIAAAIAAESNVYNMRCSDDADGGCVCDYELRLFTSVPGTWAASPEDGRVTFYDNSLAPSPPSPADYCLNGDSLEMTGHNGLWLFNRPNLRTLKFQRATCSDGVQSHSLGETGVDCGGQCEPCADPMCESGAQDGDEEGVDCGGNVCKDFCPCFNGVQDAWEEGVDCGGPCALLCQCTNGVKEPNEDGVDCGGDCQARYNQGASIPCPE